MKKMNLIVILLLFLITACSPDVRTDTAADANFGSYDTYAILPTGNDSEDNTVYTDKIIEEVNQEMQARGYELDNQNPDLLVNVTTMFHEEEDWVSTGYFPATYDYYTADFYTPATLAPYYYVGFNTVPTIVGPGIREVEYIEGTFVVDVIEAEGENEIIWRGWSDTPVDLTNIDTSIRDYVDNIFDEYPVEPNS